ncbi:HD domain-containing protein [Solihabitans fulvus]|uniref:HD domain-containing protein n=1 Tax=Solihabitans fulvus TaxID=1892852 RepID=A0A5B2WX12_9PSEU|nr:HD domain-containing protein [Solihabitans fulvus]
MWARAVPLVGGAEQAAAGSGADLTRRYAEPHRRYHDTGHVLAVARDAAGLAADLGLGERDRALVTLAACAHDVVYDGEPGTDERRSAEWARRHLAEAGVAEDDVAEVERLVLATLSHRAAPEDLRALVLLDADLAVLGADPESYERYRLAVRAEYARFDDAAWAAGRSSVLADLAARNPLYATEPARARWDAAARRNLAHELTALRTT